MPHHRIVRSSMILALAVAVASSCKKEAPKEPPPVAPVAPVVPVAAAASPLDAVKKSDAVLSLFEPNGAACAWKRTDVVAKTSAIVASFDGSCVGARVAWSRNGKYAAIWFDPTNVQSAGYGGSEAPKAGYEDEQADPKAVARGFVVSLVDGKKTSLPALPPSVGEITSDDQGTAIALTTVDLTEDEIKAKKVVVDGKVIALEDQPQGMPALAHAWKLEAGAWKRFETVNTTTSWDMALGFRALDASNGIGPRTFDLLDTLGGGDEPDAAHKEKLKSFAPPGGDGQWGVLGGPAHRVYSWIVSGEFAHTTGLLAIDDAAKPGEVTRIAGLGFTAGDIVAIRFAGPHMLVASGYAGTHPRLIDVKANKLVFSSDDARSASFWP